MNIALVHDHLISDGGGERVLKAFSQIWPEAPIYTLVHDPAKTNPAFKDKQVITSGLQRFPLSTKKYQWYLPLRPKAIERFDFADFDIVLSNSSSLAKGIHTPDSVLHINYCHTPTRFLWVDTHERLDPLERMWPVSQISDWYKEQHLRAWDLASVNRVNAFISNSRNVQQRIRQFYNRTSQLIYPPVDTHQFYINPRPENYFLTGGRLVSYKKFDIVIQAFNKLQLPLKIFGTGPELSRLQRLAGPTIELLGAVSDETKARLYAGAQAFINPQVEDFGITPVESMASGRPVVAYKAGGAQETIVDGKTGLFFEHQDWAALAHAIIRLRDIQFSSADIKYHAERFSAERFKAQVNAFVNEEWELFRGAHTQPILV